MKFFERVHLTSDYDNTYSETDFRPEIQYVIQGSLLFPKKVEVGVFYNMVQCSFYKKG